MHKSLHPNLRLLLNRISVIEKVEIDDLLTLIQAHNAMPLETAVSLFCANYFSQATTLHGHEAAGHGKGPTTIRIVAEAFHDKNQCYDLAVTQLNECRLSADHSVMIQSGRTQ